MSACIVTGEIGSGKTTLLRQLYEAGGGDGILLPRLYCGGDWAGQRIKRLGQGEGGTFCLRERFLPAGWREGYRYRDCSFALEGISYLERALTDILREGKQPVYLDEIGPMELAGGGMAPYLRRLLARDVAVVAAVRLGCAEAVRRAFSLGDAPVIWVR